MVKFSPTSPIFNPISAPFYALHVSPRIPVQERHKGEARDGLGRKVGLGEQCLSFDILFLATPFLLLLPLPHLLFLS